MPPLSKSALLATLPPQSTAPALAATAKIVVLDDDPTGTQTVHGVTVLTTWEQSALEFELRQPGNCLYILTNTRALPPEHACELMREIGRNLTHASRATGCKVTVVSRSDSTLRGHYPAETDALMSAMGDGFNATVIVPAFFAGGRITVNDLHYVADGEQLLPAGETEFARDSAFGYRSSNLREWVEEKTLGRVPAAAVCSVSISDLRTREPDFVAAKLLAVDYGGVAVVNAAEPGDLAALTHAIAIAEASGRRFLFRTAADFVAAYAAIPPRPLLELGDLVGRGSTTGGLVVVGSYVGKTSRQLDRLCSLHPTVVPVELAADRLLDPQTGPAEINRCLGRIDAHLHGGHTVAVFTSRRLLKGSDAASSLEIGLRISQGLVDLVRRLSVRPRWLVAKGGITSSDTATKALGIKRAVVLGQALPGVPVWRAGEESKWPGLAYIVFPGNVGADDSLAGLVGGLLAADPW